MAQRTQLLLTCDVNPCDAADGEEVETVVFMAEGQTYEAELCEGHLAAFREAMDIWSSHARTAGRGRVKQDSARPARAARSGRSRNRAKSSDSSTSASVIREWARAQGMNVSSRGRVSADLHAQYAKAH